MYPFISFFEGLDNNAGVDCHADFLRNEVLLARDNENLEYLWELQGDLQEHRELNNDDGIDMDDWWNGWVDYMGEDEGYGSDL